MVKDNQRRTEGDAKIKDECAASGCTGEHKKGDEAGKCGCTDCGCSKLENK